MAAELSGSSSTNTSSDPKLSDSEFIIPLMTSPFNEIQSVDFGGSQIESVGSQVALEGIRQALAGINEMNQCIVPQNQSEEEKERVRAAMQTAANGISLALSGIDAMTEELTAQGALPSQLHDVAETNGDGNDLGGSHEDERRTPEAVVRDFFHGRGHLLIFLACLAVLSFVTLCIAAFALVFVFTGLGLGVLRRVLG